MQVQQVLHKMFTNEMGHCHKKRLDTLHESVSALLKSKRLSLTALGRYMSTNAKVRHNIKRVDRLLGNKYMQNECRSFYQKMSSHLFTRNKRPLIAIDWSCLQSQTSIYVLRASVVVRGRSLVVYECSYGKKQENNPDTHKEFLNKLKSVLPEDVRPIIVTDAGFQTPWFKAITAMGWDFIGRLRNNNHIKFTTEQHWVKSRDLYKKGSKTACYLGEGLLTKRVRMACQFVVYKNINRNRKALNQDKSVRKASKSKRYAASQREAWLLVTSLSYKNEHFARSIVEAYSKRMQIEENFRDTKCSRYGFSLKFSGTKSPERMNVLLLIAAIATFGCWIAAGIARKNKYDSDYQAHSSRFKNILSVVYLGCEILKRGIHTKLIEFEEAIEEIAELIHHASIQHGVKL